MNNLFDKNITLNRDAHIYTLATNPDIEFISVTTFVSQFFEKFEAEKIATRLVKSSPKYMGMTVQDVLQLWRDAADHGTIVHEQIENFILHQTPVTEPKAIHGVQWLEKFLMKSSFKVYSEVIIYSEELQLCGTIDLLLFDKNRNEYIIMDWKTSASIPKKGGKKGIKKATQDKPYSKYNIYELQLSLSTVYKTLVNLEKLSLIQIQRFKMTDEGKKIKMYRSKIKEASITINENNSKVMLHTNT